MKSTLRDVFHATFSGLMLIVLTACGGGGSGAVSTFEASQSSPPPQSLLSAPAPQEPFDISSTTLSASSGGNSYTAIYSETPNQGTAMFHGQVANSSTISLTITENGAPTPISTEIDTAYYLASPYQPLGMSASANGQQFDFLYNSTDPLPSTLTSGNSGPLGSGTYYVVNTNDSIGSLTETYSVATWNPATLLFTTNTTGMLNGQMVNETFTYVLNGAPILSSIEIIVNGTQLTFMSACAGCWDD